MDLQEARREWERQGYSYSFPELVHMAEQAPAFTSLIDPDDELFLHAGDMKTRIRQYCRNTGQPLPETPGEITRCVLESLALKYRYILELTEQVSGQRFNGLHMVGGGIQNRLLCQWTANSVQKPVWAGPAEASAIGNLAVQWMTQESSPIYGKHAGSSRILFPWRNMNLPSQKRGRMPTGNSGGWRDFLYIKDVE